MLSVLLFGLHQQPNTHSPAKAMGGFCLIAGGKGGVLSRLADSPMWMLDSGVGAADDRYDSGSHLGSGESGTNSERIAFENLNRIGQSRSRKRIGSP